MRVPLLALVLVFGCGKPASSLAAGEACTRTVECANGLACVAGVCGSDLTDLVNGGTVPVLPDAGGVPLPDGSVLPPDGSTPDAMIPVPDASLDASDMDAAL